MWLNITRFALDDLNQSKHKHNSFQMKVSQLCIGMSVCYGQDMFTHLFLLTALPNTLICTNHSIELITFSINIGFA